MAIETWQPKAMATKNQRLKVVVTKSFDD